MSGQRSALTWSGVASVILAFVIPLMLVAMAEDVWEAFASLAIGAVIFLVFIVIGIVLLIAGAASRAAGQQQQQQVVVMTDDDESGWKPSNGPRLRRCTRCGTPAGGPFCTGCGQEMRHG